MEENAYRLTDGRNMHEYVPFIVKYEENRICQEIEGKQLSIIFKIIMVHRVLGTPGNSDAFCE